ncbi:universal stress protein [Cognatishimia sp. MH4019]|uniref:universal stress protein n=1 Tax=Cognatishimia sp. MH4019 TaxID=2854030 RepID=UPI001CD490C0|nr:universal stress protein [Cognatishimia sp. MH4019]
MQYRSISTVMTSSEADASALAAAVSIARAQDAHLDVYCAGIDHTHLDAYSLGTSPQVLATDWERAQQQAGELQRAAEAVVKPLGLRSVVHAAVVSQPGLAAYVTHRTRFSDLVVAGQPYGKYSDQTAPAVLEAALFSGHASVLVVPDGQSLPEFRRIVVAWNDSAQALNALRRALPMLKAADIVSLCIIDPPQHGHDRSDPGGSVAQMLARHGVKTEISVLAQTTNQLGDTLMRHATDINADLIVMGAYGHSRFREAIFGGATRHMLKVSRLPLFMAH